VTRTVMLGVILPQMGFVAIELAQLHTCTRLSRSDGRPPFVLWSWSFFHSHKCAAFSPNCVMRKRQGSQAAEHACTPTYKTAQ
jgi:hypothetical protein